MIGLIDRFAFAPPRPAARGRAAVLFALALCAASLAGCRSAGDRAACEGRIEEAARASRARDAVAFDAAAAAALDALPEDAPDLVARVGAEHIRAASGERDAARARGLLERGACLLERALLARPDALAWRFDLGLAALRLGDPSRAVPALERVHREAPRDDEARLLLARAYLAAGDDRAAADLLEAPGAPGLERDRLLLRGTALLLTGEARLAESCLTRALEGAPRAEAARLAYHRALAREAQGDLAGARADLALALASDPASARARALLDEIGPPSPAAQAGD